MPVATSMTLTELLVWFETVTGSIAGGWKPLRRDIHQPRHAQTAHGLRGPRQIPSACVHFEPVSTNYQLRAVFEVEESW